MGLEALACREASIIQVTDHGSKREGRTASPAETRLLKAGVRLESKRSDWCSSASPMLTFDTWSGAGVETLDVLSKMWCEWRRRKSRPDETESALTWMRELGQGSVAKPLAIGPLYLVI